MDKLLVLYTMKGCSHCVNMKEKLEESNISYSELDIDENKHEYDMFVEITENEYVPAFMIIEMKNDKFNTQLFAPERDFNQIDDGVKIIKEHFK